MKQLFKFICCGSVDDGKSTLIGRLLYDTGNVKKDQWEDARKASLKNGSSRFEYAMLLDGLLDERAQQITIDVAHRYFDYQQIRFHILDCPGHVEYTKNMAIAAAQAQAAVVVIDVTKGIREQTKNHIRICNLFRIPYLCICLTKCDLTPGNKEPKDKPKIKKLIGEIEKIMKSYTFDYTIIPVSSITGYQVDLVLKQLCVFAKQAQKDTCLLKDRVLHILTSKFYKKNRYYYGREVHGLDLQIGKTYRVYPQGHAFKVTKVPVHGCFLIDKDLDIAPGDCVTNHTPYVGNVIKHQAIWFASPTESLLLKHGSRVARVVRYTDDTLELDQPIIFHNIDDLKMNGFGIFIDEVSKKTLGCCVFTGNKMETVSQQVIGKTYLLRMVNSSEEQTVVSCLKKELNISVCLDVAALQKEMGFPSNTALASVSCLAHALNRQGLSVLILLRKERISKKQGKSLPINASLQWEKEEVRVCVPSGKEVKIKRRNHSFDRMIKQVALLLHEK